LWLSAAAAAVEVRVSENLLVQIGICSSAVREEQQGEGLNNISAYAVCEFRSVSKRERKQVCIAP
jgi:hypothetical protein